jgi:predicted dehydrogenase
MLSIVSARAGKDVFSEKPICLTVAEGRAVCDTIKRCGAVYQAGHQRRSVDSFRFMAGVVRKGMIGKLERIIMQVWENAAIGPSPVKPVPAGFDYDMWLGPTPWHPYTDARVQGRPYFWDTGGGMAVDMGCHWTDTAQFVQQKDDTTPIRFEGSANFDRNAFSDNPIGGEWTGTYADGVKLIMRQRGGFDERYIRFEGSEGWIQLVDATNAVTAQPASILKARSINPKGWGDAGDHVRNFLDCVKARNPMTTCHPESAHRATTIGHLGNICWRLGRAIEFDPVAERIRNDSEAERMLSRAQRAPWRL